MIGPGDHPNTWATLAPGTVLDAVLETFDPASLRPPDLVEAVTACERQVSHLHALQARFIAELSAREIPGSGGQVNHESGPDMAGARPPDTSSHDARSPHSHGSGDRIVPTARQVAAALTLGPGHAAERVVLAIELIDDLPATWKALDSGRITWDKAGVIAERTRHLAPGTRNSVEAAALEHAPRLTRHQLRRWLDDSGPPAGMTLSDRITSDDIAPPGRKRRPRR